jgi:sporulation protein YlmC with PRC-barrel domain
MNHTQSEEGKLYWFREFKEKKVFNRREDRWVGIIDDLMIDPNLLEVAAVVTDKGMALKRDMQRVPSIEINEWEDNAILVNRAKAIHTLFNLPEYDKWLSVANQLIGLEVITESGKRIGELEDVSIYGNGRIASYKLEESNRISTTSYEDETNIIPSIATHSLGSELLLVNIEDFAWIVD